MLIFGSNPDSCDYCYVLLFVSSHTWIKLSYMSISNSHRIIRSKLISKTSLFGMFFIVSDLPIQDRNFWQVSEVSYDFQQNTLGQDQSFHRNFLCPIGTSDRRRKSLVTSVKIPSAAQKCSIGTSDGGSEVPTPPIGSLKSPPIKCSRENSFCLIGTSYQPLELPMKGVSIYTLWTVAQTLTLFHTAAPIFFLSPLRRFGVLTMGFWSLEVLWIPHPSETLIPSFAPPIRAGNLNGVHSNLPVVWSINA